MTVHIVEHSVLAFKISEIRRKSLTAAQFRHLLSEITFILAVHATTSIPLKISDHVAETPMSEYNPLLINARIGLFPVLRAGIGMTDSMLKMFPDASVLHLGLYREKTTFMPVEYYNKLPALCKIDIGYVLDPMIATAGTAIAAINILKDWGLSKIIFMCVLCSASGLDALREAHPDVDIYIACVDDQLTDEKYVLPGLGDVGDREFST